MTWCLVWVTFRTQKECTLLRSCLALPKVSYILHTCPPPSSSMLPLSASITVCSSPCQILLAALSPIGPGSRLDFLPLSEVWVCGELLFMQAGPLISHILGHDPVTPPSLLPSVDALTVQPLIWIGACWKILLFLFVSTAFLMRLIKLNMQLFWISP